MNHSIQEDKESLDIAIIGMAGRFPGAKNIGEFWQNLKEGKESITFFSEQELIDAGINASLLDNPHYVKAAGILDDVDLFDPSFFGYSPREAEIMDPQHRIFLECAWEALEHAGHDPEVYRGKIGVYAGAGSSMQQYFTYLSTLQDVKTVANDFLLGIANGKDFLSTRVAYKLNLKGASITVQTACSTSLVAVHLACQSLLSGDCDMALAGGVSIVTPQKQGYLYQAESILSPDGHCRAFDALAQGTVRSSGVGIVVLKRLEDALQDRDYIYAVIKGSAVNNDGAMKVGYAAPSIDGQVSVIRAAQILANVEPDTISYIEAHGTGTALGDPIEIAALTQAFHFGTNKKGFCAIGSVKTNIGHLDTAAGIAGLIKTALALKNRCIPPSLHFTEPNTQIDFTNSPFYINSQYTTWNANSSPRRAGISSFGIGGTNAHVILEEAPKLSTHSHIHAPQLLIISAKTPTALETAIENLATYCKQQTESDFISIAYTLQVGRQDFHYRRFLVCDNINEAIPMLETQHLTSPFTAFQETQNRPVAFLFPGGGSQYINMGRDLYNNEPIFREQLDICAVLLQSQLGLDICTIIYQNETEQATRQLHSTSLGLPALFSIEYALSKVWQAKGIVPQAMLGHSLGEYVAACLAGVFSLEDALAVVVLRGKLLESLPSGIMISISREEHLVRSIIDDRFSIAAVNGPTSCVVSGPVEAMEELAHRLKEESIEFQRVQVDVAAHSKMVLPILDAFTVFLEKIPLQAPRIPFISNVTGNWITAEEATDPTYWGKHLCQTVRFAEGVQTLWHNPEFVLLEVGPGKTLSRLVKLQAQEHQKQDCISSMRHFYEKQSDQVSLLTAVGMLWLRGVHIDWEKQHAHEPCHRLPLPTYPFERQRYWVEASQAANKTIKAVSSKTLKFSDVSDWFYVPLWKQTTLPFVAQSERPIQQKSCWLILQDECGIGVNIEKHLREIGEDVICVVSSNSFAKINATTYSLNPGCREDYSQLFEELSTAELFPTKYLHLWAINQYASNLLKDEEWKKCQDLNFYSLLFLAQALGERAKTIPSQFWIVTSHIQQVIGDEVLYPEMATILGPCKVIPQEYPHITCCNIDIVVSSQGSWPEERLINQIVNEIKTEPSTQIIAYRGLHRWIQTFEPIRIELENRHSIRLRHGGVYLITGGLGGIGLALAAYLAQYAKAKLILVGRSVFPQRNEWETWLKTHESQEQISLKIRGLQRIEELGGQLLLIRADITDYEQVQRVINQSMQDFGVIHGVIHSAGIASGGIIQLKTREMAESVLAPKIKGALILATLLKDVALDFLVYCSSLNAITGGFGLVDYCSANAFLDASALCNSASTKTFTLSINWDTWKDVGMTANTPVPPQWEKLREEGLMQGILSEEGIDVFGRLLQTRLHQVLVSTKSIDAQLKLYYEQMNAISPIENVKSVQVSSHHRPELATNYVAPRNEIEQTIAEIIQEILGFDKVGIYDDFLMMGGDSLLALQLVSLLQATFQLDIRLSTVFEAPNVASLAEVIDEMLISNIEELPEETAQFLAQQ